MDRRQFVAAFGASGLMLRIPSAHAMSFESDSKNFLLYIGTSGDVTKGIYTATFNAERGTLTAPSLAAEETSPSFIAFAPGKQHLYACSEQNGPGEVAAYNVAGAKLNPIDHHTTEGAGTCFVSVHPDGKSVFAANYGEGSVSSFTVHPQGGVSPVVSHIVFGSAGHGPVPGRQDGSHGHSAVPSPDGNYVLVNDLGLDRIHIFHLDRQTAKLTPSSPAAWHAKPGSGPRHLALHPNGKWIYNINELADTVDLLYWDASHGTLTQHGEYSTLPAGTTGKDIRACEVIFSPDLRYLYASNRRDNESYTVFGIDPHTGVLTFLQNMPNEGKESRHFAIDPTGKWMLSANQFSNEISVYPRDPATGRLSPRVSSVNLAGPSCLMFV